MAAQPVLFRVLTDDLIPVPIDGVVVHVYTSPGDVFVTEGTTGDPTPGSGEVELSLEDGPSDYYVRMYKEGVSFPSAPYSITVDTPPPANELEVNAHVGETAQVVTLSLKDGSATPIDNVIARIYDDSDTFLAEIETGVLASGEASIPLVGAADPGQDYIVRWRPADGTRIQNGLTQVIQVLDPVTPPETNTFDFVLEEIDLPESAVDGMCLISGYLADISKQPIKNATLTFLPIITDPDSVVAGLPFPTTPTVVGLSLLVEEVIVTTNDDGYLEVSLPQGSIFNVHVHGLETPGEQIYGQVYIPEAAGARLEDVLFPYVSSVDTGSGSVSLAVGESVDLELTVTGSNTQGITGIVNGLIELTSSDEEVATISWSDEGALRITAVATGSATISVARVEGTWATRSPAIPDLVVTPSTEITVTVS